MLEIHALTKRYKSATDNALDSVSFTVGDGSFTALLGPNGAGKSTLISVLSGIVKPDAGRIEIDGMPLSFRDRRILSRIGIVPQEIAFDYVFTPEEILSLEFGYFGLRKDRERIRFLLERLSLDGKKDVPVRELSGGMKRRLMIAKALIHRPSLLLLDEPTAGVDPNLREDLQVFLKELSGEGTSIVLTTHQLEDAEKLCDRILVLDRGRLIADEARKDFLVLAGDYLMADIATRARERVMSVFATGGGCAVEESDEGVRVIFQRSARVDFLRLMANAATEIESFQIHSPSLEDVFKKITGKRENDYARVD